jgi:cysteinyl-tRNA synthetase
MEPKREDLVKLILDIREELCEKKEYSLADKITERLREIGVLEKKKPSHIE